MKVSEFEDFDQFETEGLLTGSRERSWIWFGLVVSLIALVLASFTANRELGERAKGGIVVSVFSIALLYIGVAAANYASHLFS